MINPASFRRRITTSVAFAVFVLALCVGGQAPAAIMYSNIVETPTKIPGPTPSTLFGLPPVVNGNSLDFDPVGFNATASNGGFAFTDGMLSLTMMTDTPQTSIGNFTLSESGAYSLFGGNFSSPTPNFATSAFISLNVITARVVEIAGVPVVPINIPNTINYVNGGNGVGTLVSGGIRFTKNNAVDNPLTINQPWSVSVFFDVANVAPNATKVNLFFNNTLLAQSESSPNSFAFIDKKDVIITTNEVVPEPSTVLLGTLGGLLLVGARRWRKAA